MVANTEPIFILAAQNTGMEWVNADGANDFRTVVEGGANGSKVFSIVVTSDDTSAILFQVAYWDDSASAAFILGTVNVPAGSGLDGTTPSVNLLDATLLPFLDADGELFLPAGDQLSIENMTAVTAAKTVNAVCFAGDY